MARYRYRGKFISAGRAAQLSGLKGPAQYVSSETTIGRKTDFRAAGYSTEARLRERERIAERIAERPAPPIIEEVPPVRYEPPPLIEEEPVTIPFRYKPTRDLEARLEQLKAEKAEVEDEIEGAEEMITQERALWEEREILSEEELEGLEPLQDELYWIGELFDYAFDRWLDDVDDEGEDYGEED